ncbi:MAG: polysaccharide deacetylase family protein [Sphaerochaeta sp.]|nr:polysaccharide deacetylase family protein [Sphaerochaeta sp.]
MRLLSMKWVRLVCGVIGLFAALSPLVAESSGMAVLKAAAPQVRYWKPETSGDSLWTVAAQHVAVSNPPKRKDPKIVPVLYHNIVFGRTGNIYNRDLYNFESDLGYLKRKYAFLGFQDLVDIHNGTKTIATDATVVTFDDGDLSIYAIVYPLLKAFDIPATFFLVPTFIGQVGYMDWDQVREMDRYRNDRGEKLFFFGSHSLTHRLLGELPADEVLYEMQESKRIIERELGGPVIAIALPFGSGSGDKQVLEAAKASGYLAVRTSKPAAVLASSLDLMNINAFNVENYSSDVFVQHMLRITGR